MDKYNFTESNSVSDKQKYYYNLLYNLVAVKGKVCFQDLSDGDKNNLIEIQSDEHIINIDLEIAYYDLYSSKIEYYKRKFYHALIDNIVQYFGFICFDDLDDLSKSIKYQLQEIEKDKFIINRDLYEAYKRFYINNIENDKS